MTGFDNIRQYLFHARPVFAENDVEKVVVFDFSSLVSKEIESMIIATDQQVLVVKDEYGAGNIFEKRFVDMIGMPRLPLGLDLFGNVVSNNQEAGDNAFERFDRVHGASDDAANYCVFVEDHMLSGRNDGIDYGFAFGGRFRGLKIVCYQLKDVLAPDFLEMAEIFVNQKLIGFEYGAIGRDQKYRMRKIRENGEVVMFK
jgi:hypothetical protein